MCIRDSLLRRARVDAPFRLEHLFDNRDNRDVDDAELRAEVVARVDADRTLWSAARRARCEAGERARARARAARLLHTDLGPGRAAA